jgi:hypothetical protein
MGMPVGLKTEAAGFPAMRRQQNGLGTRIPSDTLWTYVHYSQGAFFAADPISCSMTEKLSGENFETEPKVIRLLICLPPGQARPRT